MKEEEEEEKEEGGGGGEEDEMASSYINRKTFSKKQSSVRYHSSFTHTLLYT